MSVVVVVIKIIERSVCDRSCLFVCLFVCQVLSSLFLYPVRGPCESRKMSKDDDHDDGDLNFSKVMGTCSASSAVGWGKGRIGHAC